MKIFEVRCAKTRKMLNGRDYGRFVKTGIITGAAYGAELTDYTPK